MLCLILLQGMFTRIILLTPKLRPPALSIGEAQQVYFHPIKAEKEKCSRKRCDLAPGHSEKMVVRGLTPWSADSLQVPGRPRLAWTVIKQPKKRPPPPPHPPVTACGGQVSVSSAQPRLNMEDGTALPYPSKNAPGAL